MAKSKWLACVVLEMKNKSNRAGKGSSDPPQNKRIKMLKNYKEQKDMENDGIETP